MPPGVVMVIFISHNKKIPRKRSRFGNQQQDHDSMHPAQNYTTTSTEGDRYPSSRQQSPSDNKEQVVTPLKYNSMKAVELPENYVALVLPNASQVPPAKDLEELRSATISYLEPK